MVVRILIGAIILFAVFSLFGEKETGKTILSFGIKLSIFVIAILAIVGIYLTISDKKGK